MSTPYILNHDNSKHTMQSRVGFNIAQFVNIWDICTQVTVLLSSLECQHLHFER